MQRSDSRRFLVSLAGTASLFGLMGTAHAQDAGSSAQKVVDEGEANLEDIVVTARRVNERLQDVPIAVTALSGETLRNQNITRTEDLQLITPGLSSAPSPRSDTAPNYLIRGQRGAPNPSPLTDPAVAVYFAGMNLARSQGTNQGLFDLDSVQVLKGPQGTLFGRNSTGGAILITPRAPSKDLEGYLQGSLGNYSLRDFEGVVNIPLSNKLQLRGGAKITNRAGYFRNVATGVDADDIDAQSYRISLRWLPNSAVDSTFIATRYKADQNGTGVKFLEFDPAGLTSSLGAFRPTVVSYLQAELVAAQNLGKYEFRNNNQTYVKEDTWSVQNNTSINLGNVGLFGDITLKNIIGKRRLDSYYTEDRSPGLTRVVGSTYSDLVTEEFQIQGKARNFDYLLGAFYFHEDGRDTFTNAAFSLLGVAGTPAASTYPVFNNGDIDIDTRSYAFFGHGNYKFSGALEGLSLAGGIRYTNDQKSIVYHNINYRGNPITRLTCGPNGQPVASLDRNLCAIPASKSNGEFTYDASLSYKLRSGILAYVSFSHGYRSGSFNQLPLVNSLLSQSYGPEAINSYEFGVKSDFHVGDVPVRFNVAAYHSDYSNVQRALSVINPNGGISSLIINAASATVKGMEVELTLKPVDGVTVSANYAYTDARYKSFTDRYLSGGTLQTVDISDSPFAYVPKHQYSVSASYQFPIDRRAGVVSFSAVAGGQSDRTDVDIYTQNCGPDGQYPQCRNSQGNHILQGYTLVNFRLEWRHIGGSMFDAAIFANNVFDKFYATHNNNLRSAQGIVTQGVGAPRMYGLQLRASFGPGTY